MTFTNEQIALLAATISWQNWELQDTLDRANCFLDWLNNKQVQNEMRKKGIGPITPGA